MNAKLNLPQDGSTDWSTQRIMGQFPQFRYQARRYSAAMRAYATGLSSPPGAWPASVAPNIPVIASAAKSHSKYFWWARKASSPHQYIRWYETGIGWAPEDVATVRERLGLPPPGEGC
jgi:hypothetical protein